MWHWVKIHLITMKKEMSKNSHETVTAKLTKWCETSMHGHVRGRKKENNNTCLMSHSKSVVKHNQSQ